MKIPNVNFNLVQVNIPHSSFNKKLMRLILGWVGLVYIWFAAMSANFGHTSFGGAWEINVSKSEFGNLNPSDAAPKSLKVIQTNDSITIEKLFIHSDGKENSFAETFYYNGRTTERMASSTTRRLATIKWSVNMDTLIITAHAYVDDKGFKWEYNTTEKWSTTNEGRNLIVQKESVLPDRTETYKAIYDKQ